MTKAKDSRILVLIPAWNEAKHISSLVEAAAEYSPVLVVDDGSCDETAALSEQSGAYVISHGRNRGKGCALRTGFEWAVVRGYDAVITLDGDGQHDPGEIPKFISAYWSNGTDLTVGRRDFGRIPFPRNLTNWLGSRLLSLALGRPVLDASCGYRLYTRRLLGNIDLRAERFDIEAEALGKTVCGNMTVGWVEIQTLYNGGRKSYYRSMRDVPHFLKAVWKIYRLRKKRNSSCTHSSDGENEFP